MTHGLCGDGCLARAARALPALVLALLLGLCGNGCGGPGGADSQSSQFAAQGYISGVGGRIAVADRGSTIFGASVSVPAGCVASAAYITLNEDAPIDAPLFTLVGPAVRVGPDGAGVGLAATVTIPYTPAAIPAGRSPADIVVLSVDTFFEGQALAAVPGTFGRAPTFVAPIGLSTATATVSTLFYQNSTFQAAIPPSAPPAILSVTNPNPPMFQGAPLPPAIPQGGTGFLDGGETITLAGRRFQAGAQVFLDGIPAASVQVVSPTAITFVTTPRLPGYAAPADVQVLNPDGGRYVLFGGYFYFQRPP